MVLVSSTSLLTEVWGFQTGCRPDGSCKVLRVLVSFTPHLRKFGGSELGVDLIDHAKSQGFRSPLLHSFGVPNLGVNLWIM